MTHVYTKQDSEIEAVLGEPFIIELEANPTTGYEWEADLDEAKVELVERQLAHDEGVGAGGIERFTLRPLGIGETAIVLRQQRPWESGARERFVFQVHASER